MKRLFVALLLLMPFTSRAAEPSIGAKDLPRAKPLSVEEAIHSFKLHAGLQIQAAACEPQVVSPVGISFDESGRMYVVEMRDYPDLRERKLGRIRRLESTKGDGVYDKATVFADGLQWPSWVCCWNGGVFVCASPDIIYLKDTKGTGVADVKKVVFTGFGPKSDRLNVQGLVNGLTFFPDGRIYGTSSENGGIVTSPDHPEISIDLRGKGFSFDPRKNDLREENGGAQHGLSFDDFGREYVCSNAHHIQTFLYDGRYAARNPGVAMPATLIDIGVDGPAAEVFRISPEEPWRVIRTQWRKAGQFAGPVEGGGRASGYFTSASGITIYRGDALPAEFRGNAFIAEPAGNLVSRKVIHPDGLVVKAERAPEEAKVEFLASPDLFFRPVQLANGPDGALYLVDFYREVIEHPWSLPDNMMQLLDLHSGADRGRIWRIARKGFTPPQQPKLSDATTVDLVRLLESPIGWRRDTAARLICERRDSTAGPLLATALANSKDAAARMEALELLSALEALNDSHLTTALHDVDANVRSAAVRLAEPMLLKSPSLATAVAAAAEDTSVAVRCQVAFSVGDLPPEQRLAPLAAVAKRDAADPLVRAAIISSSAGQEAAVCAQLAGDPAAFELVRQLAGVVGSRTGTSDADAMVKLTTERFNAGQRSAAFALLAAIREGQLRAKTKPTEAAPILTAAVDAAKDDKTDEPTRLAAIALLGTTHFGESGAALLPLLDPRQPQAVQSAAVTALGKFTEPDVGSALVKRFRELSPRLRSEALAVLLQRPDRAMALLNGITSKQVQAQDIPSPQASFLRSHRDPHVRELARKLLVAPTGGRDDVIKEYQPTLSLIGDAKKGKLIYEARCISCHRLAGEGSAVGPDLTTVRAAGKEKMLVNILDPNREVAPNYMAYIVETKSGESLTGIIANETASSLTVREAFGKETIVLRSDLKRMASQKLSLMPEGIEAGLKLQDVADLLEFLTTAPADSNDPAHPPQY